MSEQADVTKRPSGRVWFWRCEVCNPPVMEQQESEMQAGMSGILHWNLVHDATADEAEAASHIILWDQPAPVGKGSLCQAHPTEGQT